MATIDYGFGVSAIDAEYLRPQLAAIHLIVENGRAAIIDAGTQFSLPAVMRTLADKRIAPEQVDYLILTHIHLDHAGGAGAFMQAFPNARLTVHPRGVFHMVDPSKLIAAVSAVYGEAETYKMYGDIVPVPRGRILPTPDGANLQLAGRTLRFYETMGHARHHVAIHDEKTGWMFAGDTFGLSYRELDEGDRQFLFPTTSPAHFDPQAYHRSIDLVGRLAADSVYVTHFSRVREPSLKAQVLHRLIDGHVEVALAARDAGKERAHALHEGVRRLFLDEARRFGSTLTEDKLLEIYGMDVDLNAQGLGAWLDSETKLKA
ncbi:MAG TPA: MBL fold metallo-hydrolase [Burkholderiales bacterium]|nr:MBL fold metallo-hydrolase [Burkholderiales bacterium]